MHAFICIVYVNEHNIENNIFFYKFDYTPSNPNPGSATVDTL